MQLKTMFSAYIICRDNMSSFEWLRKDINGISIDSDTSAKKWQRYKRLADRIEDRVFPFGNHEWLDETKIDRIMK